MQPAVARRETWRRKEAHARRQLSKRSVRDGKAAAGEFVRLAAAIDDCAAFNPKQWRHVLESATVLRHGGQTTSNLSNKKQTATHKPFSREEDTLVEGVTVFPPLSVTQYLNQPDLVEDILREAEGQVRAEQQQVEEKDVNAEKEEGVLVDPEVQAEGEGGEGGLEMEENMVEQEGVSPIRDDIVLKKNPTVMLPLLTTMSPRTRRGVAHLPPPSEAEVREIESFERLVDHPEFYEDFYRVLKRSRMQQAQHRSAMKVEKTDAQPFQRPTSLRKMKRPRGAIKPLQARKAGDTQPAALPALSAEDVDPTRGLDKQNCVEKEDNTRADFTSTVMVKQPSNQFKTPNRNRKPRRSSSYNRLIQERQYAEALHGAAEYQVKETLAEIKQWIPLDLIYAFGFGKFASPAQQRATEVMFRVGVRLKSQLLFLGMHRWKEFVFLRREEEWNQASTRLQCWWRQICAKHELEVRRRVREELQRRQTAFLALLATKQQQAACRITRCIRRYALQRSREGAIIRQKAAICIQRFWRQLCTQWAAVRRELQQQRRKKAAICIQKHARRLFAQRKRVLLSKIDNVDKRRRQKNLQIAARAKHMKMLGAVISIQRAFRGWQQKRVLMLRRRRAAFERDKKKILKVQAHFRGQQVRRWVSKHKCDVGKAVLILQCSWRCYLAKSELLRRKQQAVAQRSQLLRQIEEARRKRQSNILVPMQLQKKLGQISLLKATNVFQPSDASNTREAQAARRLQARWRGKQIRKRLRYQQAKGAEKTRRAVNRTRRLAAVCIQKRIRGIRGRSCAWERMKERSARRIQRVWRGYRTRTCLIKMRYAIKMIRRIQTHWKARRSIENQRLRSLNAATIQRAARSFIGRRMLYEVVRKRQILAEESAVGKVLEERTRSRVKDELLLQSFTFKANKTAGESEGSTQQDTRVDRSLYVVDLARRQWKRKGYDGIWQEVFRYAAGNSLEIDNSHFARFLKALPHAFIHKTHFPMQNADVIFAKMKEPKAKTITFPRFNKAILMLLKEKFTDANSYKEAPKSSESVDSGGDHERFLRFLNRFVLPSAIQNGKYRKMLEAHCTQRLLWSAAVLRRLAGRIASKRMHDKFVIVFHEQQIQKHQSKCASIIQLAYRCYKFRLQLKTMLAGMFIEFIDHTGRTVKLQHITSGKILTKRPIFLKGVACKKIVPLPFPGEEFHAFCERHEDSTNPNASRIPAEVYCVECEDTMCKICFDRDHKTRSAFQRHQPRKIERCSHCCSETATRECLQCGNGKVPFCDPCFPHVHKRQPKGGEQNHQREIPDKEGVKNLSDQPKHKFQALVVMCAECSERVAQWSCETCLDLFCKRCMSSYHAKGQRRYHHCHRLNYFSILRLKAEEKRDADAEKEKEKRNKQREEERNRQEAELRRQNFAATKIQALIRSFVARQSGKAYMRLVRQTQAARVQRKKDDKVRSSIAYKVKAVFGVSPALKSDTKQEIDARKQRFDDIKGTLFLQRRSGDKSKATKHWSKKQKARVLEAARTWCDYDEPVKILKGEWKNCMGTIVSTQNLMLIGSVLVFVPLANRSVVVRWEDIEPYDQDEPLRQAYVPPSHIALNVTRDFHAKISRILEGAIRKARLLYLQTIEFNRIMQYAWVVEFDKHEQKVEYWNVVLNRRVSTPPKAMQLIERMEPEDREKLDKRVELARSKLVALLNPFQPKNKPKLALRRNAVVFVPSGIVAEESNASLAFLKLEMEAIDGARFWHDKVIPNRQLGGKKARNFLAASPSRACWWMVKLFVWMNIHEEGGFEPLAKKLLSLSEELQVYVVREVSDRFERSGDANLAKEKLVQLTNLNTATLQLLVTKDQRDVEEEEARQAS